MDISIFKDCTDAQKKALLEAMDKEMGHVEHVFSTQMSEAEYEAFKRAEKEHAPNVRVRFVNFRVQYYNAETGEVVSEHI